MRGEDYGRYVLVGAAFVVAGVALLAGVIWWLWTVGRPWLHEVTG